MGQVWQQQGQARDLQIGETVHVFFLDGTSEIGILIKVGESFLKIALTDSGIILGIDLREVDSLQPNGTAKHPVPTITPSKPPTRERPTLDSVRRLQADLSCAAFSTSKSTRNVEALLKTDARLPLEYWAEGWFLRDVFDYAWRKITAGAKDQFPGTFSEIHDTHPGYVIAEPDAATIDIVPLTTHPWHKGAPYIPGGARLKPTGHINSENSYLVEGACSRIRRDCDHFPMPPRFLGIYDIADLKRNG